MKNVYLCIVYVLEIVGTCQAISYNFTSRGISSLQYNPASGVLCLDANGQQVEQIPIASFPEVEEISLSNNLISVVPSNVFQLMPKLFYIDFSGNQLTSVPLEVFNNLKAIRAIALEKNQITTVAPGCFAGCFSLEFVALFENQLQIIPSGFMSNFQVLTGIDLEQNLITEIADDAFSTMPSLIVLNLAKNQLAQFPKSLAIKLPTINRLFLGNNNLGNVPDVENLQDLTLLSIPGNQIKRIPSNAFSKLETLEELDLSENEIERVLPRDFAGLGRLYTLDLSKNKIASLSIGQFKEVSLVRTIKLSNNQIQDMDQNVFQGNVALEVLHLNNNRILQLRSNQFEKVSLLRTIILHHNQISSIAPTAFDHLPYLSVLDLSFNQVRGINGATFQTVSTSLTSLNISSNPLEAIPERFLYQLYGQKGKEVRMTDVPAIFSTSTAATFGQEALVAKTCSNGAITKALEFSQSTIKACALCSPGTFFSATSESCNSCSKTDRGYSDSDGSLECLKCPDAHTLLQDRSACVNSICGPPCILSFTMALFFPVMLILGKLFLWVVWLRRAIVRENIEKEKLLRADIRQQVIEENSGPLESLQPEEKEAVMRVLNDDMHLQTVYIDWMQLKLIKPIAQGAYGEIVLGEYCGGRVAVKRLLANRLSAAEVVNFAQEIHIMMSLRHPNIVQFIGVTWSLSHDICAVSEFIERGDLFNVLTNGKKQLTWLDHKLRMAYEIILAISYMHSQSPLIIHRDLKSKNILITDSFGCKLSDFGLSREKVIDETMTSIGTYNWLAPEMIKGERFTESIDIYSFGIVLVELATHKLPYYDAKSDDGGKLSGVALAHHVAHRGLKPTVPEELCPSIKSLIHRCISHDPESRPDAAEIASQLKGNIYQDLSEFAPKSYKKAYSNGQTTSRTRTDRRLA